MAKKPSSVINNYRVLTFIYAILLIFALNRKNSIVYSINLQRLEFMKKIIFVVLLSFVSLNLFSQQGYHIRYTIKGLANGKAYLAVCRGNIRIPVDTTSVVNGVIDFNKKKPLPIGVYRIIFKDSSFINNGMFHTRTIYFRISVPEIAMKFVYSVVFCTIPISLKFSSWNRKFIHYCNVTIFHYTV